MRAEAEALSADNAALHAELAQLKAHLEVLGVEHSTALAAAEADAASAEAELARVREAAGAMMELADQIQAMFALCEVRRPCCAPGGGGSGCSWNARGG